MKNRIGRYELQKELGRGGFGRVYQAHDPAVNRLVAIKTLTTPEDPELLRRFRNEAAAAGRLRHQNIVIIYDFGEHDGAPYLVMELLEGDDLDKVINQSRNVNLLQAVELMCQVASGLHHAHSRGIIHRDVKPANIMLLRDGTAKILDFGIALLTQANTASRLTPQGSMLGTLTYMAPEQFNGATPGVPTDIFAFGVTFYKFLAGQHPFQAPEVAELMYKIVTVDPLPLRKSNPACPEALEQAVSRMLAKNPEARYQSFDEVHSDLTAVMRDLERAAANQSLAQARTALERGQLDAAKVALQETLKYDPTSREALDLRTGLQALFLKREVRPKVLALMAAAQEELRTQRFQDALQTLESARSLDPTDFEVLVLLHEAQASAKAQQAAKEEAARKAIVAEAAAKAEAIRKAEAEANAKAELAAKEEAARKAIVAEASARAEAAAQVEAAAKAEALRKAEAEALAKADQAAKEEAVRKAIVAEASARAEAAAQVEAAAKAEAEANAKTEQAAKEEAARKALAAEAAARAEAFAEAEAFRNPQSRSDSKPLAEPAPNRPRRSVLVAATVTFVSLTSFAALYFYSRPVQVKPPKQSDNIAVQPTKQGEAPPQVQPLIHSDPTLSDPAQPTTLGKDASAAQRLAAPPPRVPSSSTLATHKPQTTSPSAALNSPAVEKTGIATQNMPIPAGESRQAEESGILQTLTSLSRAIQQKNLPLLKQEWPSIPTADLDRWQQKFHDAESISYILEPGAMQINGPVARVQCRRTTLEHYPTSTGSGDYTHHGTVHITLQKSGDEWKIVSLY